MVRVIIMFKRLQKYELDNKRFYRNLSINRLENKDDLSFGEKIELDNLRRARRKYNRKRRW